MAKIQVIANLQFINKLKDNELKQIHPTFVSCDSKLREIVTNYDVNLEYRDLYYSNIENEDFLKNYLIYLKKNHRRTKVK